MEDIVKKIEEKSKDLKNTISKYLLRHFDELENLHFPIIRAYSLVDAVVISANKSIKRFSYEITNDYTTETIDLDNIQSFQIDDLVELIDYLENIKKKQNSKI